MRKRWLEICAPVLMVGLWLTSWPGLASADSELKIAGFVDVPPGGPGGTLSLPLGSGATPVTIQIQLGIPAVQVPVQITPSTVIQSETGLPVTLADGDRIIVDAVIAGGVIQATQLELEPFPELEVMGTAKGLPAAGVPLPLQSGTTVTFTLELVAGVDVAVTLTASTKVHGKRLPLTNGTIVQVEAVLRNMQLLVTEIHLDD